MEAIVRPPVPSTATSCDVLMGAIAACENALSPSRPLDALIAVGVFPGLAELPQIEVGVWLHPDGSRVRALRYTGSHTAAATLVPPGYWIDSRARGIAVACARGEWMEDHPVEEIALCLAALRARLHESRDVN
ncbi:hypothetical protein GG804_18605 [Sphingomonas histidinilytica]|uniref:hypothetical protein n=1 Tax=Sphingomonadales TaxID=204457 RepID=UPI0007703105|nr:MULTISPECIES: hypothetical protein [Sphingomonadaceae]AMK23052.1 hypothetical protein K426_10550 [Sphingobium sp. TKS]MBO9378782.1 hypothetical protein [Rhizorhabdus histidinilytica]MCF8707835.1 hypothetical protein [Rhizorhapis sp. SPR117]